VVRVATDGFLADHVPQGLQGRIHALFGAAGTAGSLLGATVSGVLYAVEPGVPLLAMGVLYLLVAMALLVESAIGHLFGAVSAGHGRAGHSVGCIVVTDASHGAKLLEAQHRYLDCDAEKSPYR
jgi:MFS family permease